jgi:hypothetical protein
MYAIRRALRTSLQAMAAGGGTEVVTVDGAVHEATDDWIAQGRDGTVWYCGEEVKDYETFPGDQPLQPEFLEVKPESGEQLVSCNVDARCRSLPQL